MASELFNNSSASNEFPDIPSNHNNEIQRLTERIRDLEYKERTSESSFKNLNTEYQKAVSQLQHFDPVLIASTQKQLEEARHANTQLREQLSQEEQKVESMEYEISGLRQKLSNQEERSAQLKSALEKSEEESKEYGDLLIISNQRADELEETAKTNQEKVDEYEKSHVAVEDSLQKAKLDLLERDTLIAELRQSTEDLSNELQIQKREASNATKQLKSLSEKAGQLGKENRTLIQRLEDMRQTSIKLETENSAIREQFQTTGTESETSSTLATDLIEFQQRLSEAESSLGKSKKELEEEKQRSKELSLQINSAKMNGDNNDGEPDVEKSLRTLQAQLDVERQKSREVLGQLETVRDEMAELRRRYMFILEENKQLNELVEAEVFESDEFGAGMKDYEVNGDGKFTPDSALSPGQYASYDHERRRIIKRARASLLNLQERAIQDPSLRNFDPSSNAIDSGRSSASFDDSYRQLISSSLPPRVKPQHQAFMDVPKCSGCLGRAVEV
ncbi:hypothetical protein K450DRAFT_224993 [Umbelopsis ramanniana AG]|uniref:Uncharacterized protein n=1 Tax=Umbelopsis ramanniana AG TaxID=1314678 RepID=A0AAD5HHM2_UMBRA|nr:uncharacterized protein K450DRAFT_224993 [Umbelopsis ramanniana AG]KAI8582826.1 hypothetical protein K450DRAFT_224993 [Umbelopsis ramanniana AG]